MEADRSLSPSGDSSGTFPHSNETRRYLEILIGHEESDACVQPGCPECRMLGKISEVIRSHVFHVREYAVSIRDRRAPTETAASGIGQAAQYTSSGFSHSSVRAAAVASSHGTASKASAPEHQTLPLEEQVRRRAYDLYIRRGCECGSELDDWLKAEREILTSEERRRVASK